MIIEPSNYTYETMPDYTDAVDGAVEIPVTGEEIEIRYAHEVVYDEAHNLHLEIFTPFQMAHPERTWPCITFIQGSAWMKQYVYQKVGMIARLAQRGYVVAIVEYRHSGIAHFPARFIDAKNAVRFLRAHAEEYKLNPSQMFLMGDSSGGQVSSVAGMTAKSGKLDEPINEESCEVCGIIDLYGAVDVTLPYGYPITLNHQKPDSPEGMLMGYDITEHLEEAKAACSNIRERGFPADADRTRHQGHEGVLPAECRSLPRIKGCRKRCTAVSSSRRRPRRCRILDRGNDYRLR